MAYPARLEVASLLEGNDPVYAGKTETLGQQTSDDKTSFEVRDEQQSLKSASTFIFL